jgi:fatty-acyl-CoA synthase
MLNTNLRGKSLHHCIDEAAAQCLIAGSELLQALESPDALPPQLPVWVWHGANQAEHAAPKAGRLGTQSLDAALEALSSVSPQSHFRPARRGCCCVCAACFQLTVYYYYFLWAAVRSRDAHFLIYTSGTTGLPKAAKVSHFRFVAGASMAIMHRMTSAERWYCTLPLYHSAGGQLAVSSVIYLG